MANLIGKKSTVTEYHISLNKEELLLILTMLGCSSPTAALDQYDNCYTKEGTGAYLTREEYRNLLSYSGNKNLYAAKLYEQLQNMLEE